MNVKSFEQGLSDRQARGFSITRAIRQIVNGQGLSGPEFEGHRMVEKLTGQSTSGFFLPPAVTHGIGERDYNSLLRLRDLAATAGGAVGGYTIQTDVLGGSMIELLRNQSVTFELGARKLSGLVGNVTIPSQTDSAKAYWVAENAPTPGSNLVFGQVAMTPRRLSAVTVVSKQLIAQAQSLDVEGLIREDFARVMALELDRAALWGAGNDGQPLGVINTGGIGSVEFGGAATWAKVLDFETQVANMNVRLDTAAYVTTPTVKSKWKQLPIIGGQFPRFLWEKSTRPSRFMPGMVGEVNGYLAVVTKQMPNDRVLFGNFSEVVIGDWIGWDVTVDQYTLADRYQLKITITALVDVAVRHIGAFCCSGDSGAQ